METKYNIGEMLYPKNEDYPPGIVKSISIRNYPKEGTVIRYSILPLDKGSEQEFEIREEFLDSKKQ